jgi:hypothetical protein
MDTQDTFQSATLQPAVRGLGKRSSLSHPQRFDSESQISGHDLRDAHDTREVLGKEVVVGDLNVELLAQEFEQFDYPHRIDISSLEQIDSSIEPGIGRTDAELSADELLDTIFYIVCFHSFLHAPRMFLSIHKGGHSGRVATGPDELVQSGGVGHAVKRGEAVLQPAAVESSIHASR